MNRNIFSLILSLTCLLIYGQNPRNDDAWKIIGSGSDEFNGSSVDQTKWDHARPWSSCYHGATLTKNSTNRIVQNGVLSLITRQEESECVDWDSTTHKKQLTSGALFSKNTYKYGYFEVRCKLPNLKNSASTAKGFATAFWMWPLLDWTSNYPTIEWSEIDIAEINNGFNLHSVNIHYEDLSLSDKWELRKAPDPHDKYLDFSKYHIFGCEWTPDYVNFYIDDILIRSSNIKYANNLIPMNILFTIHAPEFGDSNQFGTPYSPNTQFPYTVKVDYIRIYDLKMSCDEVINKTNLDFQTFNYSVKKSITLKSSTVPSNSQVTLRATDFVELQGNFEVPLGSEFTIVPTKCF